MKEKPESDGGDRFRLRQRRRISPAENLNCESKPIDIAIRGLERLKKKNMTAKEKTVDYLNNINKSIADLNESDDPNAIHDKIKLITAKERIVAVKGEIENDLFEIESIEIGLQEACKSQQKHARFKKLK